MKHPALSRRQRGVSLIESAITITIVLLVAGFTLPSFEQLRQRRQLESTAAQLETDLQLARSEAVSRNQGVRMDFQHDAQGSCYVVHDGVAGGCRCNDAAAPVCDEGATPLRSVRFLARDGIELRSNSRSVLFDADKGTVTPTATLRLMSGVGSLHQVVNVMGRIRSCSPDGAVPGLRRC